jgi:hypothetical protein
MPPEGSEPKQRQHKRISAANTSKQKRNRPSGLTYNKSARSKGKGAAPVELVVMVQSVIESMFLIGAGRIGEEWIISHEESIQIAQPTANIINHYMDTELMTKYSDPIALMVALGVVCVPRVVITASKTKGVKKDGRIDTGKQNDRNSRPDGGGDIGGPGEPGIARKNDAADDNELSSIIDIGQY